MRLLQEFHNKEQEEKQEIDEIDFDFDGNLVTTRPVFCNHWQIAVAYPKQILIWPHDEKPKTKSNTSNEPVKVLTLKEKFNKKDVIFRGCRYKISRPCGLPNRRVDFLLPNLHYMLERLPQDSVHGS